ncbi:hypothetical protein [Halomarina rubra]|uniref:DUF8151 domain-containing protein n=1 Tax=Halomarina rubra TaxID=2071873 RepID=A0ABD6AUP4_9EURY|nr:hypothetical protein [Halomarina rubra]
MSDFALEPLVDLFQVLVYGFLTTLLTVGGLFIEQTGVSTLATDTTLGLWMAGIGAVALGAAYLVATDRFLPSLRALTA